MSRKKMIQLKFLEDNRGCPIFAVSKGGRQNSQQHPGMGGVFEVVLIFCVMQLLPQALHDQTNQRIRSSIRKQNPIDTNGEMEIKTSKRNWTSETDERPHNRFGSHLHWERCQSIKVPAARNQQARTRPHSNSVFHAAAPTVL